MFAACPKSANCLRGILVLVCLGVSALAEQPIRDNTEQFLREHNISITKQDVVAALWNNDAAVRKAASHFLSNRWPTDAAVPIQEAMLREEDGLIRVSLANDLAQVGETAGREKLLAECHNSSEWGSTRVLAARFMFDLHDDSCVDAVLEILRSDSDPQDTLAKVDALNLAPIFVQHFTDRKNQSVMDLTVNALNDADLGVRITAATTLGRLADPSAITALQAALANEQDATGRNVMLIELKGLRRSQKDASNRR
jgi:HEAT repeat protein